LIPTFSLRSKRPESTPEYRATEQEALAFFANPIVVAARAKAIEKVRQARSADPTKYSAEVIHDRLLVAIGIEEVFEIFEKICGGKPIREEKEKDDNS
jgi:hypothetical protein